MLTLWSWCLWFLLQCYRVTSNLRRMYEQLHPLFTEKNCTETYLIWWEGIQIYWDAKLGSWDSLSPLFCFPDIMNLNSSSKLGSPRIWACATHVKWVSPVKYGVPQRACPLAAVLRTPYSNTLLIQQKFNSTKTQNSWGSPCYFSSCKISIKKCKRQCKRPRGKDSRIHSPTVRCYQAAAAAQLFFLQTL